MDFELFKSLLHNTIQDLFQDDDNLFSEIQTIANQIVLDESGFNLNTNPAPTWLIEPYAYIVSQLATKRLQGISESLTTTIDLDYKKAIKKLNSKKESPVIKLSAGTTRGIVW